MREHSGHDKGNNNNLDPTLDEHAGGKGPAQRSAQMTEGPAFDIGGNVKLQGQDPSPDDRARGETSDKDAAAPIDIDYDNS